MQQSFTSSWCWHSMQIYLKIKFELFSPTLTGKGSSLGRQKEPRESSWTSIMEILIGCLYILFVLSGPTGTQSQYMPFTCQSRCCCCTSHFTIQWIRYHPVHNGQLGHIVIWCLKVGWLFSFNQSKCRTVLQMGSYTQQRKAWFIFKTLWIQAVILLMTGYQRVRATSLPATDPSDIIEYYYCSVIKCK